MTARLPLGGLEDDLGIELVAGLPLREVDTLQDEPGLTVIADDDPDDVLLLRDALTGAGLRSIVAVADGGELLDLLHGLRADVLRRSVVFLDLMMPGLGGVTTLQRIRVDRGIAPVSVVVVSGSTVDEDIWSAQAWGAVGYLVKPASMVDVASVLKRPSWEFQVSNPDRSQEERESHL